MNSETPKSRNKRPYRKHAIVFGQLIDQTLERHGIAQQVQAALIVREGNEWLSTRLEQIHQQDLRVLCYKSGILSLVCRHSAASFLAQSIKHDLKDAIEQALPYVTIQNVEIRIDPHTLDRSADTLV